MLNVANLRQTWQEQQLQVWFEQGQPGCKCMQDASTATTAATEYAAGLWVAGTLLQALMQPRNRAQQDGLSVPARCGHTHGLAL
jgi:hypothetical protein